MACPRCNCKVVYSYDDEDDGTDDRLQRCSACGFVFDLDDHADEKDDDWVAPVHGGSGRMADGRMDDVQVYPYCLKTPGPSESPTAAGNSNRIVGLLRNPPKGVM